MKQPRELPIGPSNEQPRVIGLHTEEIDGRWYGVGFVGRQLVATSVGPGREMTLRHLVRSLPSDVPHQVVAQADEFLEQTLSMLVELESGHEENKAFSLAVEQIPEPLPVILEAAAAIPIGYVTSYGNIAKLAQTEARVVGRVMASNPLYPIVPCHRVVGADFALVGYRGRTAQPELQAKLDRLRGEVRGWPAEKEVLVGRGRLEVYPVERVLHKAERQAPAGDPRQQRLFE